MKDQATKDNMGKASIRFEKGTIIYSIFEEKDIQMLKYAYIERSDSIISYDLNTKTEQITKYKFEGKDKLILETNGIRSVFIKFKK